MNRKQLASLAIVGVVVAAAFGVRAKFERFVIPQNGMFPNCPAGSTHWVTKNPYRSAADIAPGDEVVIRGDEIKINGAPLQHIRLRSEGNIDVFLEHNGQTQYEVAYDTQASEEDRVGADVVVPAGHVFVLGDNRYSARDSRYHGPVPFTSIIGKT